jgi:SAM-dependent methyltransferase
VSLDRATGRDRYFEQRERELAEFVDPETGGIRSELGVDVDCPLCGCDSRTLLFEKHGFGFARCASCRLVYVSPRLRESVLVNEYRGARANELWFDVLTSETQLALDRRKFSDVLARLEPHRGSGELLDVGCSIGSLLDLARARGWNGTGLELSPRALAHAREELGLNVLDATLAEAGFDAGHFDAVALLSVVEHVAEPLELLRECARVLRPGGALYVIVPNVESLACRVLRAQARTFDGRNHLVYFSPATLSNALARTGFAVEWIGTKVSSLDAVLAYLAGADPYAEPPADDALAASIAARRDEAERLVEELGLGYKLHALATRSA